MIFFYAVDCRIMCSFGIVCLWLRRIQYTWALVIECWKYQPNTVAGTGARKRAWTRWTPIAVGMSMSISVNHRQTVTSWNIIGDRTLPSVRTGQGRSTVVGPAGRHGLRVRKMLTAKSLPTNACVQAERAQTPNPSTTGPIAKVLPYRCDMQPVYIILPRCALIKSTVGMAINYFFFVLPRCFTLNDNCRKQFLLFYL